MCGEETNRVRVLLMVQYPSWDDNKDLRSRIKELEQQLADQKTLTEKISNWKLNRRKLELEVEKLQLDVESARMDRYLSLHAQRVFEVVEEKGQVKLERAKVELDEAQLEREKLRTQVSILKRLEKNPIRLIDMSLMVMESEDKKGEGKEMTESGEEKSS